MKSVVIASGKGGTGKTTLTALFAHFAAQTMSVVVADADVEASNLPLALHSQEAGREAFQGGSKATIDPAMCVGCGLCECVCRFGAVAHGEDGLRIVNRWACEGCGYCAQVCATDAIEMRVSTAGVACLGASATGTIAYGQLGPGEDMSGRLVTEVRRLGKEAAEENAADLVLVDGPPGIGCPVIAASANTDVLVGVSEPTLSGEHDLARLADLAARLGVPMVVVLNKADLSESGAERIRRFAESRELPILAEVPFDSELARTLDRLARESVEEVLSAESPGIVAAKRAWLRLVERVGLL